MLQKKDKSKMKPIIQIPIVFICAFAVLYFSDDLLSLVEFDFSSEQKITSENNLDELAYELDSTPAYDIDSSLMAQFDIKLDSIANVDGKNKKTKQESIQKAELRQQELRELLLNDSSTLYDFSLEKSMKNELLKLLGESQLRKVRIAVLGDSFIEGDIITMDIRENLQSEYSGGGVGFVPITSTGARIRKTVKHSFSKNWTRNCITSVNDSIYTLSGEVFLPKEGAWVKYEVPKENGVIKDEFTTARLLFRSLKATDITVKVNEEEAVTYRTEPSDSLQQIVIDKPIHTIHYSFHNTDSLAVYGTVLDKGDTGVSVDNYSIRGNLGIKMTNINKDMSYQLSEILPYDMIVLQYGLNIVEEGRLNYNGYIRHMNNCIKHIKECYPQVPILVIGVSERAIINDNKVITMPGIAEVAKVQRKSAFDTGVLFWSTLSAMRKKGGMETFVANKWAAKDYTHLSATGGAVVAGELYQSVFTPDPNTVEQDVKPLNMSLTTESCKPRALGLNDYNNRL